MKRPAFVFASMLACVSLAFAAPTFAAPTFSAQGGSTKNSAEVDPGLPSAAIIAAQERLDKLGDLIVGADANSQIATTEVDQGSLTLTVRIKGPMPAPIALVIKSADKDITIKIEEARYSMTEMQAAARRIHEAVRVSKTEMYGLIISNNDGSGLTVRVPKDSYAKGLTALDSAYQTTANMPVSVEPGEAPEPTSRVNDADPWSGGAAITGGPGGFCSTAFPVLTSGGYGRLLAASHCDFYGNSAWDDGSGDPFTVGGSSVSVDRVPYDTMLMDPIGGTQGRVYGGPSTHPVAIPGTH